MGEQEIELEQENIIVHSGGAVNSVNGQTGDVVLTTSDLENTSDYQTGTEVESAISAAIAGKQDTLTAGNNITISNNTISATDTTYTAGTGLDLTDTTFSVDTATIATQQDVSNEATARENADTNLQGQIDAISASSDVKDIVGTKAELNNYDTSTLGNNDIIKVLQDESENDATTYYRWNATTQQFTLIGEEGPYYTKAATDTLLDGKQDTLTAGSNITITAQNEISATDTTYSAGSGLDLTGTTFSVDTTTIQPKLTAGSNITIDANNEISATDTTYTAGTNVSISSGNVISATDTTYSNFVGTDGTAAGAAGLVPAPATTDAGKFLKADGTWDTAGGSTYTAGDGIDITNAVISATNTGKARVLTTADYNWPTTGTPTSVALWLLSPGVYTTTNGNVRLRAYTGGTMEGVINTVIIGGAVGNYYPVIAMGPSRTIGGVKMQYIVANITGSSINNINILTGHDVYAGLDSASNVSALAASQGKVLKNLVDSLAIRGAGAPTTATVGQVGTLYEDTTNGDLYICTDATNPYVWEEVGAGGGSITPVQTPGTSTTDVMSQNAVTSMVFADPATQQKIKIGANTSSSGPRQVVIGERADGGSGAENIAIGYNSLGTSDGYNDSVSIGREAKVYRSAWAVALGYESTVVDGSGGVAIGAGSRATQRGQVDFSSVGPNTTGRGYNNSNYRLLTGLYDPQNAHDAANKEYVDSAIIQSGTAAPTTSTAAAVGALMATVESGTGHLYICTDDTGGTYTWQTLVQ